MRISPIKFSNFSAVNSKVKTNSSNPILNYGFDSISFRAKTQEEVENKALARDLSKKAYKIFMVAKSIAKQGDVHKKEIYDVYSAARSVQKDSKKKFDELNELFNYAKENKVKAVADYDDKSEIFFEDSGINQTTLRKYQNGELALFATKNAKNLTVYDYRTKKPTRMIFSSKTGELLSYDGNIKTSPKSSTPVSSDVNYVFEHGKLSTAKFGNVSYSGAKFSKKIYEYAGTAYTFMSEVVRRGESYSFKEGYYYSDGVLDFYQKNYNSYQNGTQSADYIYNFKENRTNCIENYVSTNYLTSAETVYSFENSKIRQVARGYSSDNENDSIAKLFTYNEKEIPQYCYVGYKAPQTDKYSVFKFPKSQENFQNLKTLWLG